MSHDWRQLLDPPHWHKFNFSLWGSERTPPLVKPTSVRTPAAPKKIVSRMARREGLQPRRLNFDSDKAAAATTTTKRTAEPVKVWQDGGLEAARTPGSSLLCASRADKENLPDSDIIIQNSQVNRTQPSCLRVQANQWIAKLSSSLGSTS